MVGGVIGSVLIANRGEIARRVIRTARRLGVRTIAVYSDADAQAVHVKEADVAVRLGPAPARESYLVAEAVLEAARATGAEAIHPGYGFLSENAAFAEAVEAAGLVWIGPPANAIRAMGLKDAAKRLMAEAGVPVTPGYLGDDQAPATLAHEAAAIGWPVLIKAVAGGGGKGMRKVERGGDFDEALSAAKREARSAFGDDRVLLEKFVTRPRHIEVQVFADAHSHVVHLFERDCSLQRRHQKVIEEAPAPGMDAATREQLCAAAVRAAQAVDYRGAGTVEFIADASEGLRADRIWFMEMNTRLQVEHPVTEAVTGLDLVEWQLRVASGEPLPLTQDQIRLDGHAIEARLYAEDPANGFLPSTGRLAHFTLPNDVRADSAVVSGNAVTSHYDPMLAKLIAHASERTAAINTLAAACAEVEVWPVKTNAWFLARCLEDEAFIAGEVDTAFIEARLDRLTASPVPHPDVAAAAAKALASRAQPTGFRLNSPPQTNAILWRDGGPVEATIRPTLIPTFDLGDDAVVAFEGGAPFAFTRFQRRKAASEGGGDGALIAPMPGRIVSIVKAVGDAVKAGETVLSLEAMKMEHGLKAPFDGVVAELSASEGGQVSEGQMLARIAPAT